MAKIFISYAHKDEDHKNALTEHLSPLVRTGLIEEWNDRKLVPGTNWANEISENFSVHDKFHRALVLSGFFFLKIARIFLNSSFFPKPIKRRIAI